jgi:hypothetical protein
VRSLPLNHTLVPEGAEKVFARMAKPSSWLAAPRLRLVGHRIRWDLEPSLAVPLVLGEVI